MKEKNIREQEPAEKHDRQKWQKGIIMVLKGVYKHVVTAVGVIRPAIIDVRFTKRGILSVLGWFECRQKKKSSEK